ncbi:uncharacterized protein [Miscanthus floridulus]|uniref:uncharacterized protein n=1 Tax=Miscanthus floridulus TaxID=154761 RepID=UPI0034574E43
MPAVYIAAIFRKILSPSSLSLSPLHSLSPSTRTGRRRRLARASTAVAAAFLHLLLPPSRHSVPAGPSPVAHASLSPTPVTESHNAATPPPSLTTPPPSPPTLAPPPCSTAGATKATSSAGATTAPSSVAVTSLLISSLSEIWILLSAARGQRAVARLPTGRLRPLAKRQSTDGHLLSLPVRRGEQSASHPPDRPTTHPDPVGSIFLHLDPAGHASLHLDPAGAACHVQIYKNRSHGGAAATPASGRRPTLFARSPGPSIPVPGLPVRVCA